MLFSVDHKKCDFSCPATSVHNLVTKSVALFYFKPQISSVVILCDYHLHHIRKVLTFLIPSGKPLVSSTNIGPCLGYGNSLYFGIPIIPSTETSGITKSSCPNVHQLYPIYSYQLFYAGFPLNIALFSKPYVSFIDICIVKSLFLLGNNSTLSSMPRVPQRIPSCLQIRRALNHINRLIQCVEIKNQN